MVRRRVTSVVLGAVTLAVVAGAPVSAASQKKTHTAAPASKAHATATSKPASSGTSKTAAGTASTPTAAKATGAAAATPAGAMTDERAVDILRTQVVKDGVLDVNPACVDFEHEETSDRYVVIALRERHDHRCGGDPRARVTIDRFRVNRATGHIDYLDVLENEWYDYAGYKDYRGE